jgi:hypothetical protein
MPPARRLVLAKLGHLAAGEAPEAKPVSLRMPRPRPIASFAHCQSMMKEMPKQHRWPSRSPTHLQTFSEASPCTDCRTCS